MIRTYNQKIHRKKSQTWEYYNFGWLGGYATNNHSIGYFGLGVQSSADIEGLWNIIKSKIKSTYHVIPQKNVLHFIR